MGLCKLQDRGACQGAIWRLGACKVISNGPGSGGMKSKMSWQPNPVQQRGPDALLSRRKLRVADLFMSAEIKLQTSALSRKKH